MNELVGKWARPGIEMNIMEDKIRTTIQVEDQIKTLIHDYLLESNYLRLYSPVLHDIKKPFKGEIRVVMITTRNMWLETEGTITFWKRR